MHLYELVSQFLFSNCTQFCFLEKEVTLLSLFSLWNFVFMQMCVSLLVVLMLCCCHYDFLVFVLTLSLELLFGIVFAFS